MRLVRYWILVSLLLCSPQLISSVYAHGATDFPKSRALKCNEDGGWGGDTPNIPNKACRDAVAGLSQADREYHFSQWHEYARLIAEPGYEDFETVKREIPDGTLCSANDPRKNGMNLLSTDWYRTTIKPVNGKFEMRYRAQVPHNPSYFEIFLSKPGYSPTQPLKWSDLEKIADIGDLPVQDIDGKPYYVFDVPIPAGRSGYALMYTRWQRNDSAGEGFYSCADVTIEQGEEPGFPWHERDYFVTSAFEPKPGERVRFRLMSHERSGRELVDYYVNITEANQNVSVWAKQLADALNAQHGNLLRVGIRSGDEIGYDQNRVYENRVYVANENDQPVMSIIAGGDNRPPVADAGPDQTVTGATTVDLNGRASHDPDGDALTYRWTQTAGPDVTIWEPEEDRARVALPAVTQTTAFTFRLTVTDSEGASDTDEVTITATAGGGGEYPVWPDGIGHYQPGVSIVVGSDRQLWRCRAYPQGAWCNINAPAYEPGGPGMEQKPEWQAWERYNRR